MTVVKLGVTLLFIAGDKVESILVKILDWLKVNVKDLKSAWKSIHKHLMKYMKEDWLKIVDLAIKGLCNLALKALEEVKATVMEVCETNRVFMQEIRKLDVEYSPGIVGAMFAGAASGAAIGGFTGTIAGGPIGAGVGAVLGGTAGAISGFIGGALTS